MAVGFNFGAKNLSVKPNITKPDDPTYHLIEDGELHKFMTIGAPKSLLLCTACIGYVFGELKTICDFITKIEMAHAEKNPVPFSIGIGDTLYMFLIVAVAATAIATGIYALSGKSEVTKILNKIRARAPIKLKP